MKRFHEYIVCVSFISSVKTNDQSCTPSLMLSYTKDYSSDKITLYYSCEGRAIVFFMHNKRRR